MFPCRCLWRCHTKAKLFACENCAHVSTQRLVFASHSGLSGNKITYLKKIKVIDSLFFFLIYVVFTAMLAIAVLDCILSLVVKQSISKCSGQTKLKKGRQCTWTTVWMGKGNKHPSFITELTKLAIHAGILVSPFPLASSPWSKAR